MKMLIRILFPFQLHMHMFQLERYKTGRYLRWIAKHFWTRSVVVKKPLVYTGKIKRLFILSTLIELLILIAGKMIFDSLLIGIIVVIIMATQPYVLYVLSLWLTRPYEVWNWHRTVRATRKNIGSCPNLTTIAITGSYGKTSVKNILYHFLRSHHKTLKTPASYNTVFGIAKTVQLELDDSYKYFICEMGAFKRGDIAEMCNMVQPNHGILTGLASQHLERFGSFENIIKGKFELPEYILKSKGLLIVNGHNEYITRELESRKFSAEVVNFDKQDSLIRLENITISHNGQTRGFIISGSNKLPFSTKLLGKAHLENITIAAAMALKLGVTLKQVVKSLETLPQIPHRNETSILSNGTLLIDNAYSSNVASFKLAINLLSGVDRQHKIFVTPGIVELGEKTKEVHQKLGEDLAKHDFLTVLIGDSPRTQALAEKLDPKKTISISSHKNLWIELEQRGIDAGKTVVLFENDTTENY